MARPKGGYRTADGQRVPGTTTITGRFKESGGLIYWAWNEGREGRDYRDTSGAAATAGTLCHEMIEAKLLGQEWQPPSAEKLEVTETTYREILAGAEQGFAGFRAWYEATKIEIVATEASMVSERHRFGGTLDAVAYLAGKLYLLDWKAANGIYADYLCQVAAYRILWEENNPGDKLSGAQLLRVSKQSGAFHHHGWPLSVIDKAGAQFLLFRQAYELDRFLKKEAA